MSGKYSQAQNKATQRHIHKNYDQFVIRVPKGTRDKYSEYAQSRGTSLNKLVVELLEKEMNGRA